MAPSKTRIGDWMQTSTGRQFWPIDPRPDEVDIRDIAHHLSNICRFTGAVSQFYSVAEHSVHVSRLMPRGIQIYGLLHDASEAYICDLARPVKKHSALGAEYELVEKRIQDAVWAAFGLKLTPEIEREIDEADKRMLAVEALDLMRPGGKPLRPEWDKWTTRLTGAEPAILCHDPKDARTLFLRQYDDLFGLPLEFRQGDLW